MSSAPRLDGRRAKALEAELLRRADAVLGAGGRAPQAGPVARAIFAVAARIGEEVTRRLDLAPAKQEDNFYTAAGIGRDPARPATVPVAFSLVETARDVLTAAPRLQLMTDAGGPVIFETAKGIDLVPGTIAALRGLDAQADSITIPSAAVMAGALPRPQPPPRRLRSGAAAGAVKLQIDPAAGLAPGALLRIGEGEAARHYRAVAVAGDLVTIEPPLEAGLPQNAPAFEVVDFAPFASVTRNHQSHALYLGHASLLDVPSAVTISISGVDLPAATVWSWWGKLGEDDPPAWHALDPDGSGAGLRFRKQEGKPVKTTIRDRESLWLRAELPGRSAASAHGRDVRIAIGGGGACDLDHVKRCAESDGMTVGFEAVANSAPVVTNRPFHPFGREPRLYDSFYIGCDEAFSKVGAEISLCFDFAGPDLGPLAGIKEADATYIFGVGIDGLLYRARLSPAGASIAALPSPSDEGGGTALLRKRSPVAIWKKGSVLFAAAAAAGGGAVYVAELADGADLAATKWIRLPFDVGAQAEALAVHGGAEQATLYARVGAALLVWTKVEEGAVPDLHGAGVRDLVQIEPSDPLTGVDSVLIVEATSGQLRLVRIGRAAGESAPFDPADLPSRQLSAFVDPRGADTIFVAGYDKPAAAGARWQLQLADIDAAGASLLITGKTSAKLELDDPLPVAFSPGVRIDFAGPPGKTKRLPVLSVAAADPFHVLWDLAESDEVEPWVSREPASIGASANPARGFLRTADYVAVQRPDRGLFYRANLSRGIVHDVRVPARRGILADADSIAASPHAIVYFDAGRGFGLTVVGTPADSGRAVLALADPAAPSPTAADDIISYALGGPSGAIGLLKSPPPGRVSLANSAGAVDMVAAVTIGSSSPIEEIWRFTRTSSTGTAWPDPGIAAGSPRKYVALQEAGRAQGPVQAALFPALYAGLTASRDIRALWTADNEDVQSVDFLISGGTAAIAYPHDAFLGDNAVFFLAPKVWQEVGSDRAGNPALSWEYWNGQSWWALPTAGPNRLIDRTAHFMQSGGVFFKVPPDIQPNDVGGRPSHWLRVRLVIGDYGEPRMTSVSRPGADGASTEQIIVRDVGAVRAPYVTSLKLGYCASEPVRPEYVLTEDSLDSIDQTSANEAGLDFPVFTPVAELMNPRNLAEDAAEDAADAGRCDDPCPSPPGAADSPCEAAGAYDSCDSPCIAPTGHRRAGPAEISGFVRGLMLGFSRPFSGNTVSLYVDAEPGGLPAELAAEMLRDGRFVPVEIAGDTSYGLSEPGILTLAMVVPPDRSDLFGAAAHWLRLRPKTDAASWSPRLRAVHLNAALARSAETRTKERLGVSIGLEGQEFRLSAAPVDYDSLVLRVREILAEEDDPDGTLDVAEFPVGLPGHWVRWQASEDLIEADEAGRVFQLDADQGIVRFGDGETGRIPPPGAEILAESYARVVGDHANHVAAGTQLQLLAPLAGVERVTALDHAAGGSDTEPPESARRRAAAKIRHGRHILTRADLEDHALTLSPGIAQVRAESRGGGMRLVVAMKGADPRPSPAARRQFAAAIREVAGYGLARPGGLNVVSPRLLPIAVRLVLQPAAPDLFAEAAEQARSLLVALFDPEVGNHDGKGWPMGRLPEDQDIAAALVPIDALALPVEVAMRRDDKETAAANILPASIPSDVLVRLHPAAIAFERSREEAA